MVARKPLKIFPSIIIVIVFLLFTIPNAEASENKITGESVLKFTTGIITAFSIHEASHALVAEACNIDLDWEAGTYNQPLAFIEQGTSDSKGLALYSAGLVSQLVGSEIILHNKKIDKNSAFVRGIMAWNIINPILYALDYWIIHRSNKQVGSFHQGDLEGIEYYSSESTANGLALSMAGIAAYQGVRYLKTQSWAPDWMKSESVQFYMSPIRSDGAILSLVFKF